MTHGVVGDRSTVADCDAAIAAQSAKVAEGVKTQASAAVQKTKAEAQNTKSTSDAAGAKKAAESSTAGGDAQSTVNEEIMMKGLGEITGASGIAECIGVASDMLSNKSDQVVDTGFDNMKGNSIQTPFSLDVLFSTQNAAESINGDFAIQGTQTDTQAVATLTQECAVGQSYAAEAHKHLGNAHLKKATLGAEQRHANINGAPVPNGMGGRTANANRSPYKVAGLQHTGPESGPSRPTHLGGGDADTSGAHG